jgi:predicted ATPase
LSTDRVLALADTDAPRRSEGPRVARIGPQPFEEGQPFGKGQPLVDGLPLVVSPLVGRAGMLAEVAARLAEFREVTLTGAPGVGKSRLAVEIAHTWAGPVRFVDLDRTALPAPDPAPPDDGLLVLDNCDSQPAAVGELIPAVLGRPSRVTVLATTRRPLRCAVQSVVPVRPLPPAAAAELFRARARAHGAGLDEAATGEDVARICELLDYVPLALELAAARTTVLSLPQLIGLLGDRFALLTGDVGGPPRHRSLRASVDWSWAELTPLDRLLLCRLAVIDGPFSLPLADDVCGDLLDGPATTSLDVVSGLVTAGLMSCDPSGPVAQFRLSSTVRRYASDWARRQDGAIGEQATARSLLAERIASEVDAAVAAVLAGRLSDTVTSPGDRLAMLCEQGGPVLAQCRRDGSATAVRLVSSLGAAWLLLGELATGIQTMRAVLDETAGDHPAARVAMAALLCATGDADRARTIAASVDGSAAVLEIADAVAGRARPDDAADADPWQSAIRSWRYCDTGQVGRARGMAEKALGRARGGDRAVDVALASLAAGRIERLVGEFEPADRLLAAADAAAAKVGVGILGCLVAGERGALAVDRHRDDEARRHLRPAIDIAVRIGSPGLLIPCLDLIGRIRLREHDIERARQSFLHVLRHSTTTADRYAVGGLLGLCEVGLREPGPVASWTLHDEAYDVARGVGSVSLIGRCQLTASALARFEGDADRAWSSAVEALSTFGDAGLVVAALDALDALAQLAAAADDPPGAILLLAAADALRARIRPDSGRYAVGCGAGWASRSSTRSSRMRRR